jgi:hypothetical protein
MKIFLEHRRIIPFEEFQNLERRITDKLPMKAQTDPNFMNTAILDAVCGIPFEDLRDRQHILESGNPEYKSYVLESSNGFDRRKFERVPMRNVLVTLVTAEERFDDVEPADVSYGGCALIMEREADLHPGQRAGVSIRYGDSQELLLPGEIVNMLPHGVQQRIGMRFDAKHASASVDKLEQLMQHCLQGDNNNDKQSETKAA